MSEMVERGDLLALTGALWLGFGTLCWGLGCAWVWPFLDERVKRSAFGDYASYVLSPSAVAAVSGGLLWLLFGKP